MAFYRNWCTIHFLLLLLLSAYDTFLTGFILLVSSFPSVWGNETVEVVDVVGWGASNLSSKLLIHLIHGLLWYAGMADNFLTQNQMRANVRTS